MLALLPSRQYLAYRILLSKSLHLWQIVVNKHAIVRPVFNTQGRVDDKSR